MKFKINISNILEYGQRVDSEGNPHQEDCIFPAYNHQKDSDRLFILCDGMGGHEAGEVASSTVCDAMSKSVFENNPEPERDFTDEDLQKAITDAFDALDSVEKSENSDGKKMGTTMTFLKFHNKGCTIAHMGDSRVYHIRPGKTKDETKILFVTRDHSLVNDLIRVGALTPEEAKKSKQKNIITRAMQPNMERRPKADIYHTTDIKAGDYFYMCSDGMLEHMEDENIKFHFSDANGDDKNKIKTLTKATSQNKDNHSAILIHILEVMEPQSEEKNNPIVANTPKPIMAEIDEEEIEPDIEPDEQSRVPRPEKITQPKNKFFSRKRKKLFLLYTSLTVIVIAVVIGIYYISSLSSKTEKIQSEEMESPFDNESGIQDNKIKQNMSSSPERSDNTDIPAIPDDNQPAITNQHGSSTTPMTNDSNTGNASTSIQASNNGNPESLQHVLTKRNLFHTASSTNNNKTDVDDDEIVTSDQQNTIDAANKSKRNRIQK